MEEIKKPTTTKTTAKPKRKRRTKAEMLKAKQVSNLVEANLDSNYKISKVAREDCYVYAIKRVSFDPVLGTATESKEQLVMYRVSQVHKAAIWQNGEIAVNVRERQLQVEYGINNVTCVNDPYEYE
jgi:hypothetical protein